MVPRREVPKTAIGRGRFDKYFGNTWKELPTIHIYDLANGTSKFFCVGWRPVICSDGETVSVGGWEDSQYVWHWTN